MKKIIVILVLFTLNLYAWQGPKGNVFKIWGNNPDEDVLKAIEGQPPEGWKEVIPSPEKKEMKGSIVIFSYYYDDDLSPYYIPDSVEYIDEIKTFAACKEYEVLTFAIYAKEEQKNISIEVSDLVNTVNPNVKISSQNIDIRVALNMPVVVDNSRQLYTCKPSILVKEDKFNIPSEQNRQIWLNFWVPEKTPEGNYEGIVSINQEEKKLAEVKIQVRVLPIILGEPITTGQVWYGPVGGWKGTYQTNIPLHMEDLRENGLNSLFFCNIPPEMSYENNEIKVEIPYRMQLIIESFKKSGMDGPIIVDARSINGFASNFGRLKREYIKKGEPFPESIKIKGEYEAPVFDDIFSQEAFKTIIKKLIEIVKEKNWTPLSPLYCYVQEEATNKQVRLEALYYYTHLLPEVGAKAVLVSNGPWGGTDEAKKIGDYLDVRCYNYINKDILNRTKEAEDELWLYNYVSKRLSYGFYSFKIGSSAVSQWAYQWGSPSFFYEYNLGFPSSNGPIPAIEWIRMREGIDDSRYLYLLIELISKARNAGKINIAKESEGMLNKILEQIPSETIQYREYISKTSPKTYQIWRWQVASEIMKIQNLLKE